MAGPGKPGRKKGGRNRKPTFKKPPKSINIRPKTGRKANRTSWKKGETGNPKGRPKGSGTVDIHKAFFTLLGQEDGKSRMRRIDQVFFDLFKHAKRGSTSAHRTLLAWGVGMPAQMIRIAQGVDIEIGAAPDVENANLSGADNVVIDRSEAKEDGSSRPGA